MDDSNPTVAELADDAEQLVDLGFGKRGGRLVHDEDFRIERERLRDLDQLLGGHGEIAHSSSWIEPLQVQLLEEVARPVIQLSVVEDEAAQAFRLAADEDVLRNR